MMFYELLEQTFLNKYFKDNNFVYKIIEIDYDNQSFKSEIFKIEIVDHSEGEFRLQDQYYALYELINDQDVTHIYNSNLYKALKGK